MTSPAQTHNVARTAKAVKNASDANRSLRLGNDTPFNNVAVFIRLIGKVVSFPRGGTSTLSVHCVSVLPWDKPHNKTEATQTGVCAASI
jgi:hypothetical protein